MADRPAARPRHGVGPVNAPTVGPVRPGSNPAGRPLERPARTGRPPSSGDQGQTRTVVAIDFLGVRPRLTFTNARARSRIVDPGG